MTEIVLDIEVRENTGTGNARAARRAGALPGVLYGGGKDSIAIGLSQNEVVKAINSGELIGKMIKLSNKGKKQFALTQDIQFHPVTDVPMHIDFYRVNEDSEITVEVGTTFVGEDVSPGLKKGGTMNVVRYSIEVNCPAGDIPETIEVDVSELEIGDSLHISDLKLPKGVTSAITDRDPTVLTVVASRVEVETDEDEEEGSVDVPTVGDEEAGEESEGEG